MSWRKSQRDGFISSRPTRYPCFTGLSIASWLIKWLRTGRFSVQWWIKMWEISSSWNAKNVSTHWIFIGFLSRAFEWTRIASQITTLNWNDVKRQIKNQQVAECIQLLANCKRKWSNRRPHKGFRAVRKNNQKIKKNTKRCSLSRSKDITTIRTEFSYVK